MSKSERINYSEVMKVAHGSSVIFGVLPVFIEKAGIFDGVVVDIDDGIVGEFGDLQRVAGGGFVGEREAAVEDDVVLWIEWVRVNENRDLVVEGVSGAGDGEFRAVPMEREFRRDAREQAVAARVAPENEVAVGNVGIGDSSVVFDGSFTAELETPLADGVGHGGRGPLTDLVVHGLASRADHGKGVQEGVVDWALEAVPFSQMLLGRFGYQSPTIFLFFEMGGPGAIGRNRGTVYYLAVQRDQELVIQWRMIMRVGD
jgi:hypothetical protein